MPAFITEPARQIEVIRETDVLVVGSGPGGLAAALAAAYGGPKESWFLARINQSVGWVLRHRTRTWSGVETLAAELQRRSIIPCDEVATLLTVVGVRELPAGRL